MHKYFLSILLNKRNVYLFIISIVLALVGMAIVLYEPQLLGKIIDCLNLKDINNLENLILMYITCSIIGNVSVNICKYLISRINSHIIIDLRNVFFSKIISAKISKIETLSKGDLISKFETDITIVANFLTGNAVDLLINIFSIVLISVYVFNIDVILSVILLIFIPIQALIIKKLGKISKKNTESFRKLNSKYLSFFEISIMGIKDIKSFKREHQVKNSMKNELNTLFHLSNKASYIDIFINIINKIFLLTINVLIISFFISRIINGNTTVGQFIAFFNYTSKFYSAIFGLTGIYTKWKVTSVSLNRIFNLLNIPQEINSKYAEPLSISNKIKLNNISFSYDNESEVFENLNISFKENRVNLVLGNSGIGKTTICELLLKFYDPNKGTIMFDTYAYSQLDYSFIREKISYISQSPVFFENIFIKNFFINPNDEDINNLTHLLKEFNLSFLSESLFKSFNFDSLSVGQRQRMNIIRGILKNANLYIFDEPTSSIDSKNKEIILNKLYEISEIKTIIIITHDQDVVNYFENPNIILL